MKITLLFVTVLAFLCFVDGKPHNEGKRAHQIKRAKEHEMSNRMGHGDHHRREHSIAHKTDLPHRTDIHEVHKTHKLDPASHKTEGHKSSVHKKAEAIHRRGDGVHKTTSGSSSSTSPVRDIKKDLHLQHVTEHNIQKKQHDDKDGIPMESERLIHVTPRPPKVHKINKPHHKPTPTTALKTNTSTVHQRPSSSKAKAHKPPKKYSPKKHGWKKSARKEKGKDKAKEKRERREKRNKALHHAVIAKNL
ncbi:transcription initiation factor TFIID subunit 1-like isoform X3 [Palaemon carinicauda]|uniref:transcription initiation factor TFIID subunit 1-like isoform X3 n=1 Tax=Palaemon carinicauda TaxID=392227 RepID=UPI0035B5DFAE